MKHRAMRFVIAVLAGFVALTAIGGGIAMLVGADQFPAEWLRGTPFRDYTIPALLLAVVVGGSSLLSAVLLFTAPRLGLLTSMAAGVILTGYVFVEVLILRQVPPGPTAIEVIYLCLGLLIVGLAAHLRSAKRQPEPPAVQ